MINVGNYAEDLMKGPRFVRKGKHWWGIGNPHLILKCDKHGEYSKHHDDPDQECPKCKKDAKKQRYIRNKEKTCRNCGEKIIPSPTFGWTHKQTGIIGCTDGTYAEPKC